MKAFPIFALLSSLLLSSTYVFALEPELEEAFLCGPKVTRNPSLEIGSCFYFSLCREKEAKEQERLSATLENKYVAQRFFGSGWASQTWNDNSGEFKECEFLAGARKEFDALSASYLKQAKATEAARENAERQRKLEERKNQEKLAKEQDAAEKARKLTEIKEYRKQLLNGSAKIVNFQDASLFYADDNLNFKSVAGVANSPLLSPDGAAYQGKVIIEFQEANGILRCKAMIHQEAGGYTKGDYVFLKTTKNSVKFSADQLKVNGLIKVVGKYVGNVQYTTVIGVQKTAPVLEVIYQDDFTQKDILETML